MDEFGHAHELTFTTYQRFRFVRSDQVCEWLADAINAARISLDFQLWTYVFMADHAHLGVYPGRAEPGIAQIFKKIKEPVSNRAFRYLEAKMSIGSNDLLAFEASAPNSCYDNPAEASTEM